MMIAYFCVVEAISSYSPHIEKKHTSFVKVTLHSLSPYDPMVTHCDTCSALLADASLSAAQTADKISIWAE